MVFSKICISKFLTLESLPSFVSKVGFRGSLKRNYVKTTMMEVAATNCSEFEESKLESSPSEIETVKMASSETNRSTCSTSSDSCNKSQEQKKTMSKRALKRIERIERCKQLRKMHKGVTKETHPDFDRSVFECSDYYFENGLRKVYPYPFNFTSYVKQRWFGRTIMDVFATEFQSEPAEYYKNAIESGYVSVNGNKVSCDHILKSQELIAHQMHRHENPVSDTPIEIISDTDDLLVINKPSSIPCHPCGRYRFNTINFILAKEYGYTNLRSLYRLDRLTSGILIMGKTHKSTSKYINEIKNKLVQKEYVCRVIGKFPDGDVECDQPIDVISHKLGLRKVCANGKASKTLFQRLSYNGTTSVVKCIPYTGRTHQIRVHLQYLGYPIVNDPFYNSEAFGPNKGKGGVNNKSDQEIAEAIMKIHNVGLWIKGENPLYFQRLEELKAKLEQCTDDPAGSDNQKNKCDSDNVEETPLTKKQKLDSECENESVNKCENLHSLQDESKLKFQKLERPGFDMNKWIPDKTCGACRTLYVDPDRKELVMYLHALSYKGSDWEYRTTMPDWAKADWTDD